MVKEIPKETQGGYFLSLLIDWTKSRNRDSGGVGLGLAIVKLIATKLNLSIKVEQSTLGGALFFNTWYKYKNRLD